MIDDRFVTDVDLPPLDERRHRNDDGEVFDIPLEVVRHRYYGALAVAHEHDLRSAVEQARIGPGDIKAAKCLRSAADSNGDGGKNGDKRLHC